MAGAVVKNLIDISVADASTGWAGASGGTDSEAKKQGTGSWTYQTPKNALGNGNFTPAANINMTANYTTPHLYWVMRCDVMPFTEALNTGATNSGLMLKVSDGSGNFVQWHVAGSDTWDGAWKNYIFDLTNTTMIHSTSGVLSLADVALIEWITDNSNSGTIRIIDNTWLDAVRYGDGLSSHSVTTEAYGFADIGLIDVGLNAGLNDNYYQVLQDKDGVLFTQGKVEIGRAAETANFISSGETVYFLDRVISADHHAILGVPGTATDIDITGLVTKTVGLTGAEFDFSNTSLTSFSMASSTLIGMGSISFGLGTVDTSSFTACGTVAINNCAMDACSLSLSDAITITGTGTVTGSDINNSIGATSIFCSDLASVTGNNFLSDGANHAVELSSIGSGSMIWDNQLSGYDAGSAGSPITPTSTGNEALYINVATASDFTVNVADGASVPSIRVGASFTGNVNVVAGQKTFSFTVNPSFTGYEWRIYTVDAVGSLTGAVEIAGEEVSTQDNQSISHGYTSQVIAVQILSGPYVELVNYYTLTNTSDLDVTLNLTVDNND